MVGGISLKEEGSKLSWVFLSVWFHTVTMEDQGNTLHFQIPCGHFLQEHPRVLSRCSQHRLMALLVSERGKITVEEHSFASWGECEMPKASFYADVADVSGLWPLSRLQVSHNSDWSQITPVESPSSGFW